MNPTTIVAAVNSVLSLIGGVLPLLGTGNSATNAIGKIITTLTDMGPLIVDQIGKTYTGVKNIINTIGSHPATNADQLAALQAFDKQVDDAWNAVESQIDPDAPAAG